MKKIKVIGLALILVLAMNSLVFAEGLTDVEVDGWAEQYINKVVETDVMPAYSDATFRPHDRVTYMEVIDIIYRTALLKGETTTEEVDQYLVSHQETIDSYLIPQTLEPYGADNHRAIAYALDREILRTSELSLFFKKDKFDLISKVNSAVYISKALNVYLEEDVNTFYEQAYKDGGEISLMAWPYINLLIKKEIVSEGGSDGYFYPNSIVNRDIFSVMASGLLREIEGFSKADPSEPEAVSTLSSTGKVSIIHYDKNIVEIRDQYNSLNVYDATGATLTLNGEAIALENLEPGLDVKITTNAKTLVTLDVVAEYKKYVGTMNSIGIWISDTKETYKVIVANVDDGFKYLKALNSVIVERDYQPSTLDDIDEDDKIIIHYEGLYIKKIESFSNKVVIEGALERSTDFTKGDAISIKLFNGKLIEQTLLNHVTKTNMDGALIKGDIVKLTMNQGVITAVEATGFSTEAHGRVTEIKISKNSTVTIVNNKGISKAYNIAKNVVVKNLGSVDSLGLYALRLDQDVSFELTSVSVTEISINKAVEKTEFEAMVTEVHHNINLLKATDQAGKTWIISLEGSDQNISDYAVGNKVYVYGVELSQDLFEADLIIVLEE